MDLATVERFFGWCAVINLTLLALSAAAVIAFRERLAALHARMYGVEQRALPAAYFWYLGTFKIGAILLSVTPWLAIQLI